MCVYNVYVHGRVWDVKGSAEAFVKGNHVEI